MTSAHTVVGKSSDDSQPPTILVADDYDGIVSLACSILAHAGYNVVPCACAQAVLDYLRDGKPAALIVSDIAMPCMGGCLLARNIQHSRPRLPMLFVTGYGLASLDKYLPCASECTIDILQKPFDMQRLLASVSKALGRQPGGCRPTESRLVTTNPSTLDVRPMPTVLTSPPKKSSAIVMLPVIERPVGAE